MPEIKLRLPDDDLVPLLRSCDNDGLDTLVQYITDKGSGRLVSELDVTDVYQKHSPDHKKYADEISAEIQKFGGNTIFNILRGGEGVLYKEIVVDVAKKLKVNFNEKRDTEFIEQQILLKVLENAWEKMTDDQKGELLTGISDDNQNIPIPKSFPMAALQAAIKLGGFTSYKIALIVANAIAKAILGRGLPIVINAAIARYMSVFAGPIGWAITAIWTILDVASPAYRVTVPCVVHISMLRQMHILKDQGFDLKDIS